MSYDILLYPRRPDQDWDEVLEADEAETSEEALGDETALAEGVATFRRIASRLGEQLTGTVETWVAEETGGDVFGELSVPATGLQVELFHGSAAVSFPYWEHDDLEAFHEQVRQAVRVVAEETGYEAYDPQTGVAFDGTFDDAAGREATRQIGTQEDVNATGTTEAGVAGAEGAVGVATTADASGRPITANPVDPRRDPAFLRRRGILYLILGAVLTAYGAWQLSTGNAGWLTYVVLAIGVFDLVGGLVMLNVSRRTPPEDTAVR